MSELKVRKAYQLTINTEESDVYIHNDDFGCGGYLVECYLKSEADKVIADLEQKLAAAQQVLRLNEPKALYSNLETMGRLKHEIDVVARRERRHKYKRCLAMAEACMHKRWRPDEGFDYARSTRHMNKWLEIAEKFK